jgi:hypothetical protein
MKYLLIDVMFVIHPRGLFIHPTFSAVYPKNKHLTTFEWLFE